MAISLCGSIVAGAAKGMAVTGGTGASGIREGG